MLLAVFVWWLFSGNGPQGPSGNDPRYAVTELTATPSAGASASGPVTAPNGVRIDSYVVQDDLRLLVNYRVPRGCSDDLRSPRVLETEAAVTVTLTVPTADGCQGRWEPHTLTVLLDSPLGGRSVLDGSRSPQVRVEETAATYE